MNNKTTKKRESDHTVGGPNGNIRTLSRNKRNTKPQSEDKPKKLTGIGFNMVLTLTIIKDISDIFLNLSVFLSMFVILTGSLVSFVVCFYLFYNNVKPTTRKVVTYITLSALEIIPGFSLLPATAINLLGIRSLENSGLAKTVMSKFSGLIKTTS
jgi:hypothetical protein